MKHIAIGLLLLIGVSFGCRTISSPKTAPASIRNEDVVKDDRLSRFLKYIESHLPDLCISTLALAIAAIALRQKCGTSILGDVSISSDVACQDQYVSSILLNNMKDKAVAVLSIWVRFGHNVFVQIDDFEESPLILEPFGVFTKSYEPIDMYAVNSKRLNLNEAFNGKYKIFVVTTSGFHRVRKKGVYKNAEARLIHRMFYNCLIGLIQPYRSVRFENRCYGSNAKFLAIFRRSMKEDKEEVVPVYPNALWRFPIDLPTSAVESAESLRTFLESNRTKLGNFAQLAIVDLEAQRRKSYSHIDESHKSGSPTICNNWIKFMLLGKMGMSRFKRNLEQSNRNKNQ